MRIYLDDEREAPEGWHRVRWPEEALLFLRAGQVSEISLDHDLGFDCTGTERTGYEVLLWIEEQVATAGFVPPIMLVHSQNPSGGSRMRAAIQSIENLAKKE